MGRKKLPIKLIQDKDSRHVTFSKRRAGLVNKARQLSVLCDADVALLIFSGAGNLYQFSSGDSLGNVVDRYYQHLAKEEACSVVDNKESGQSENALELLQIVQSYVQEPGSEHLAIHGLGQLEEQLTAALTLARSKTDKIPMKQNAHQKEIEVLLAESGNGPEDVPVGNSEEKDGNPVCHPEKATLPLFR